MAEQIVALLNQCIQLSNKIADLYAQSSARSQHHLQFFECASVPFFPDSADAVARSKHRRQLLARRQHMHGLMIFSRRLKTSFPF
jgi:hypothetical protein